MIQRYGHEVTVSACASSGLFVTTARPFSKCPYTPPTTFDVNPLTLNDAIWHHTYFKNHNFIKVLKMFRNEAKLKNTNNRRKCSVFRCSSPAFLWLQCKFHNKLFQQNKMATKKIWTSYGLRTLGKHIFAHSP